MSHIGLDFGTTTSILSYRTHTRIEAFKLGGAAGTHYIPTVLALEKGADSAVEIGVGARLRLGDPDYQVYQHFKMLLAEHETSRLKARGFDALPPREAALRFIGTLIQRYQQERGIKQIQSLVITVPEIWVREGRHAAREVLKGIGQTLKLPLRLLSEPVAAALYFAECFRDRCQKPFHGHVLVCDYGGGTLDLSLSHIADKQVTVLEGMGKGNAVDTLGIAGVAFDEAVLKRVLNIPEIPRDRRYFRLLKELEEQKIGQTAALDTALMRFRNNAAHDKKVFIIGDGHAVMTRHLAEAFDQLIAPHLTQALKQMQAELTRHQLDCQNPDQFRVLMVGGFSHFYLVREAVRQFFGSRTAQDRRFETCFGLEDTALAISKGAALHASGAFEVNLSCPISVGIRSRRDLQDEDTIFLQRGTPLQHYRNAQLSKHWFEVQSQRALDTAPLTLFLDIDQGRRRYLKLEGKLRDFLPNPNASNKWKIGFSVDDDQLFTLHIQDKNGVSKQFPLGNLEEKLDGLHIVEEAQ